MASTGSSQYCRCGFIGPIREIRRSGELGGDGRIECGRMAPPRRITRRSTISCPVPAPTSGTAPAPAPVPSPGTGTGTGLEESPEGEAEANESFADDRAELFAGDEGNSCDESDGDDMDGGIDLMRRRISARDKGASAVVAAGSSRCGESALTKLCNTDNSNFHSHTHARFTSVSPNKAATRRTRLNSTHRNRNRNRNKQNSKRKT